MSVSLTAEQRAVYRRYAGLTLPRHTSYPAVPFWRSYTAEEYADSLERSNLSRRALSIYVHIPFCEQLCYYCSCTKEIVPRRADQLWQAKVSAFLSGLERELELVVDRLDQPRPVQQFHLGGGSPTYLDCEQLARLTRAVCRTLALHPDAELAVEVDPRHTTVDHLHTLRELGFNRISIGVQDFEPRVLEAVNRVQPFELVAEFLGICRRLGFNLINFDLIYGLPFQTPDSMARTVSKTIALRPDRIAFYRMAVIPEVFRWQNLFKAEDLPGTDATLEMFLNAIDAFQAAGYKFVGLDHFALPSEPLAVAERTGTLRRTFQGMTTGAGLDVIGLGPSAITILDDAYAQNLKTTGEWLGPVKQSQFATFRGMELSEEDKLRRDVIERLYCYGLIEIKAVERRFGINFWEHFADELRRLEDLVADGLVEVSDDALRLTFPLGRVLVRVVAAVFDAYLPPGAYRGEQPGPVASRVG